MDATSNLLIDPAAIVRSLDAGTIRERLAELDRERDALKVLLRPQHELNAGTRQRGRPMPTKSDRAAPTPRELAKDWLRRMLASSERAGSSPTGRQQAPKAKPRRLAKARGQA